MRFLLGLGSFGNLLGEGKGKINGLGKSWFNNKG